MIPTDRLNSPRPSSPEGTTDASPRTPTAFPTEYTFEVGNGEDNAPRVAFAGLRRRINEIRLSRTEDDIEHAETLLRRHKAIGSAVVGIGAIQDDHAVYKNRLLRGASSSASDREPQPDDNDIFKMPLEPTRPSTWLQYSRFRSAARSRNALTAIGFEKNNAGAITIMKQATDEKGNLKFAYKGKPVMELAGVGITDANGRPVFKLDSEGKKIPRTDAEGNIIYTTITQRNPETGNLEFKPDYERVMSDVGSRSAVKKRLSKGTYTAGERALQNSKAKRHERITKQGNRHSEKLDALVSGTRKSDERRKKRVVRKKNKANKLTERIEKLDTARGYIINR